MKTWWTLTPPGNEPEHFDLENFVWLNSSGAKDSIIPNFAILYSSNLGAHFARVRNGLWKWNNFVFSLLCFDTYVNFSTTMNWFLLTGEGCVHSQLDSGSNRGEDQDTFWTVGQSWEGEKDEGLLLCSLWRKGMRFEGMQFAGGLKVSRFAS